MIEKILNKISVKPPYFALSNMVMETNETLSAMVPVEQPMGNEYGIISAAEAGRHMAILGSCALSIKNPNPGRHYYLAVGAKVKKISNLDETGVLFGKANVVHLDKRNGIVSTKLFTENGQLLFIIEVTYKIMQHNLFEKLFIQNKQNEPFIPIYNSPYQKDHPLSEPIFTNNILKTSLGPLQPNECQGHFQNFPAVPVAILMHSLSKAAGQLLAHNMGNKSLSYIVERGVVKAENLAFAGSKINIVISQSETEDYNFICRALSDKGMEYGSMDLSLRPIAAKLDIPKLSYIKHIDN
ncbi:MAG: hypothetical protein ABFS35_15355 [Bacteroidota bacterium]